MSALFIGTQPVGPLAEIVGLPYTQPSTGNEVDRLKAQIARELHDQVAQNLTAVMMQTQVFVRDQRGNEDANYHLAFVQASLREVLNNVRQMLADLRGQDGMLLELVEAIRDNLLPSFQRRTGMKVHLRVGRTWPASLPPEARIHIYRIIQEALANAQKHGGAQTAEVVLRTTSDGRMVISIRDRGRGIGWLADGAPIGVGILGMRERAALLGGVLTVRERSRGGTAVTAMFTREAMRWSPKRELSAS